MFSNVCVMYAQPCQQGQVLSWQQAGGHLLLPISVVSDEACHEGGHVAVQLLYCCDLTHNSISHAEPS
jgi:hypothetical protein